MSGTTTMPPVAPEGVRIALSDAAGLASAQEALNALLQSHELVEHVVVAATAAADGSAVLTAALDAPTATAWVPAYDTLQLCESLQLDTVNKTRDLEHEILISLLASPLAFPFPSVDELLSGIYVRRNIVQAARSTLLDFHTTEAKRPADCWTYADGKGFTILPGSALVDALKKATQPATGETLYSFSCYRATEYVILLGIAQEAARCNPELLARLQRQSETRAVMSGQFHDVYLREYGSMEAPLPPRYFVPGDRTWFRNPDEASADVTGYEGSWVFYLGGGLFTNFWERSRPFSMTAKCVEIYHWRHGTYRDAAGELQMDESIVRERVARTLADPAETERVLERMIRLRDPRGVYAEGGCIDTSREHARWVRPGTSDIVLPDAG